MYGSKPSAQRRQLNGGARGHTTLGRGNRGTSRGRGRGVVVVAVLLLLLPLLLF